MNKVLVTIINESLNDMGENILIKMQLVVPRKDYINPAWELFLESYKNERSIDDPEQGEFKLEELVIPVDELHEHQYDADVVISRGLLSRKLREFKLPMPI